MEVLQKLRRFAGDHGVAATFWAVIARLTHNRIDFTAEAAIQRYKCRVSSRVAKQLGYRVQRGPFTGLQLTNRSGWSPGESAAQCLGLYEQEIQNLLVSLQQERRRSLLIDVGGADGFFALGSLKNNLFDRCIVYEATQHLRDALAELAETNGLRDRLEIRGFADEDSLVEAVRSCAGDCIMLCDIEGGEYPLFGQHLLRAIEDVAVIIELHEFDDGMRANCAAFLKQIGALRETRMIRTAGRDFSEIPGMEFLSDMDRALLASEGRKRLGKWLYLPDDSRSTRISSQVTHLAAAAGHSIETDHSAYAAAVGRSRSSTNR